MKVKNTKLLAVLLALSMISTSAAPATVMAGEVVPGAAEVSVEETVEIPEETAAAEEAEEVVASEAEEEVLDANAEAEEETEDAIDAVKALIEALPDLMEVTADKADQINAAKAAYDALPAVDQATLDTTVMNGGQPYGRVLETALWGLEVLKTVDNSTTLADGTYDATTTPALSSKYSKGKSTSSRDRAWSVTDITVADGKAVATITVESSSYGSIRVNGQTYDRTNESGNSVFSNIPIDLNSTFYIAAKSSSMGTEIAFSITTTIEEPEEATDIQLIDLEITNGTAMFKALTATLEITPDETVLVMSLSGSGYKELFMGTYEEAVANDDGSAENGNSSWIHGVTNAAGLMEFRILLSEDELDGTLLPVVAVSNSYYTKYLNGVNELARAFYPRQIKVNKEARTLETGDLNMTNELTVTNKASIQLEKAELNTIGGPNSNGYVEKLILTGTGFTKAFIGTAAEAAAAEETIAAADDKITLIVKENATGGTVTTDLLGKKIVVSLYDAAADDWTEFQLTADKSFQSLLIESGYELAITNKYSMFKALTASLEVHANGAVLVMALNGTGYKELYKGTFEAAVANGDGSADAGNDSWIHCTTNADGKYEFRIPLSASELDGTLIPMVAVSDKNYKNFLAGTAELAAALMTRQIKVNKEALTLETGNLDMTTALAITNNGSLTLESAELNTVGGPAAKGYAEKLILTGITADKAFIGTPEEALEGEAVAVADGKLTLTLKANDDSLAITTDNLEKEITVSFHDAATDTWTEVLMTVSKENQTLTVKDQLATKIIAVENVSGGVKLTWEKRTDAYKYVVYYRTSPTGKWKKAATTRSTTYTKKSLKSGTTYYFMIRCLNKKGKVISGYDSAEQIIMYRSVPSLKSNTVVPEGIRVSWKAVKGASAYRVLMKQADGTWTKAGDDTTDTCSVISGLNSGAKYTFTVACLDENGDVVSAYNTKGKSSVYVSPTIFAEPDTTVHKTITFNWEKNENVGGYLIQYSTSSTFKKGNKSISITGSDITSKMVSKLKSGKTYYVRIRSWVKIGKKKYYSAWTTLEKEKAPTVQ